MKKVHTLNQIQQTTAIAEKTVRLFLSSKAVASSKPVNKSSSISSKTVVLPDNLSFIGVVSAIGPFLVIAASIRSSIARRCGRRLKMWPVFCWTSVLKKSLLNKSHTPDTSSEKCLFSFGKQHTLSLLCFVSFWIEVSKS